MLTAACPPTAPPSAPRDLSSTALSAEGRLQLSWSPPLVTGGRSDLTYSVLCEHCNGGQCVPCGDKIRFEPGPASLQDTLVVVTDLDAHLNYTFTVEAHSGVSQFSTEKAAASLTTALDYTGEWRRQQATPQMFLSFFSRTFDPEYFASETPGLTPHRGIWSHPLSPRGFDLISLSCD